MIGKHIHRTSCTLAAIVIAFVALASAYVIQLAGYEPCVLCLRQRVPYMVGIPFLMLAYFADSRAVWGEYTLRLLNWVGLISFATVAFLAANHVGVEQGWWEGPSSCVARTLDTSSLEAFTSQIRTLGMVSCNTPSFTVLGFSLAWWNLGVTLTVTGILVIGLTRDVVEE